MSSQGIIPLLLAQPGSPKPPAKETSWFVSYITHWRSNVAHYMAI